MSTITIDTIIDQKYRVIEPLGAGGFGAVYKAEQIGLSRVVALKLLHSHLLSDREVSARFEREARLLSELSHRHVTAFFGYGLWHGRVPYIVMEYLEGQSLRAAIRDKRPMQWRRALQIVRQVADGLSWCHKAGVIHRDLKPENIFLLNSPRADFVKVTDFGLARLSGASVSEVLTAEGTAVGSALYMSPEQCLGHPAEASSDIYSLGCVLFELLTSKNPFDASTSIGVMNKQVNDPVPSISDYAAIDVPPSVVALTEKLLAKASIDRHRSMAEVVDQIDAALAECSYVIPGTTAAGRGTAEGRAAAGGRATAAGTVSTRRLAPSSKAMMLILVFLFSSLLVFLGVVKFFQERAEKISNQVDMDLMSASRSEDPAERLTRLLDAARLCEQNPRDIGEERQLDVFEKIVTFNNVLSDKDRENWYHRALAIAAKQKEDARNEVCLIRATLGHIKLDKLELDEAERLIAQNLSLLPKKHALDSYWQGSSINARARLLDLRLQFKETRSWLKMWLNGRYQLSEQDRLTLINTLLDTYVKELYAPRLNAPWNEAASDCERLLENCSFKQAADDTKDGLIEKLLFIAGRLRQSDRLAQADIVLKRAEECAQTLPTQVKSYECKFTRMQMAFANQEYPHETQLARDCAASLTNDLHFRLRALVCEGYGYCMENDYGSANRCLAESQKLIEQLRRQNNGQLEEAVENHNLYLKNAIQSRKALEVHSNDSASEFLNRAQLARGIQYEFGATTASDRLLKKNVPLVSKFEPSYWSGHTILLLSQDYLTTGHPDEVVALHREFKPLENLTDAADTRFYLYTFLVQAYKLMGDNDQACRAFPGNARAFLGLSKANENDTKLVEFSIWEVTAGCPQLRDRALARDVLSSAIACCRRIGNSDALQKADSYGKLLQKLDDK